MLDVRLHIMRHITVEVFTHAQGHPEWLVGAEIGALALRYCLMQGIHAGKHLFIDIDIMADLPA
jgi:hypothetical protein